MPRPALVRRHRRRQPNGDIHASWSPTVGRCAAGMLGVLVAESWPIGSTPASGGRAPIAAAMVDLARSLTRATTPDRLGESADRHHRVAGPAWLLPLALVPGPSTGLAPDIAELVARGHVPTDEVDACVAYVNLAAHIVAHQPVRAAIADVTDLSVPAEQPLETGCHATDGLTLGGWALTQPASFAELGKLTATSSPPVAAAAAGLVGLRDNLDAIPATWYRQLDLSDTCLALAPTLQQTPGPQPAPTAPAEPRQPDMPTQHAPTSSNASGPDEPNSGGAR